MATKSSRNPSRGAWSTTLFLFLGSNALKFVHQSSLAKKPSVRSCCMWSVSVLEVGGQDDDGRRGGKTRLGWSGYTGSGSYDDDDTIHVDRRKSILRGVC
jgi:hypothetical protein